MLIRNGATILLFFTILPAIATAQLNNKCPSSNPLVCQVMQKLNCSQEEAKEFAIYVTKKVTRLQVFLSWLASEQYSAEHKKTIIDFLLREIFTANAMVSVSSAHDSDKVTRMSIEDYLSRLANLTVTYNYESAHLYFSPNFLNLAGFEYFSEEGYYEMVIMVKQYFNAKSLTGSYADVTHKNLSCEIRLLKDGKYQLKWKSIQAERTSTVTQEELAKELKEFDGFLTKYFRQLGIDKR